MTRKSREMIDVDGSGRYIIDVDRSGGVHIDTPPDYLIDGWNDVDPTDK